MAITNIFIVGNCFHHVGHLLRPAFQDKTVFSSRPNADVFLLAMPLCLFIEQLSIFSWEQIRKCIAKDQLQDLGAVKFLAERDNGLKLS